MKKTYKKINTLGQILMLVLVFLCGINVTYAYFTARATVEGNLTFYDLNIKFYYKKPNISRPVEISDTEFEIISNQNILRGKEFKFMVNENGTLVEIEDIRLGSSSESCPALVRAKVIARKVNKFGNDWVYDEDSTDYGNFIELTYPTSAEGRVIKETKQNTNYYFYESAIDTGEKAMLASGATVSTSAPVDITNCNLKITIVFEAVQANYQAAVATFGADGVISAWNIYT